MEDMKPFLGIVLVLLAIIGAAYTLSSKFRSKINKVLRILSSKIKTMINKASRALSSVKSKVNKALRTSPKKSTTNDQRILDIIVAITDIYRATEKDN